MAVNFCGILTLMLMLYANDVKLIIGWDGAGWGGMVTFMLMLVDNVTLIMGCAGVKWWGGSTHDYLMLMILR